MIIAINAALSHGKDTLGDDMINHTAGRGMLSEVIRGLFASSTAGTMTTSSPKALEEHAENLWVLLHEASSAKVDKPGDCGDAVSDLEAFTEEVSMPGFSKLHISVARECTAGCTGQNLCSYGGNAPVPRGAEPISESVLFLQSPDLLPDFNLQADPLLFMTLVDEKTLGPPCVLCKSRIIASRHQTVYPEILRLDITTVLQGQPV